MTGPQLSPADMDRLSKLAFNLSHNEKTRKDFAGLVKQVDPNAARAFGARGYTSARESEMDLAIYRDSSTMCSAQG